MQTVQELKNLENHHEFVMRTDCKSLCTQMRTLVNRAQNVAFKELQQRRSALRQLLDQEDTVYEKEFAQQVKSRLEEDIKERNAILMAIKAESIQKEREFLKSKRIQQNMNSCYEIREALRQQERQIVQQCQLQQMKEEEMAAQKARELDNYWLQVQKINMEKADALAEQERCVRDGYRKHAHEVSKQQILELQEKKERQQREQMEEKKKLEALAETIRLEDFTRKHKESNTKKYEYAKELNAMIQEKKTLEEKERLQKILEHRQLIEDLAQSEALQSTAMRDKKAACFKATTDYLKYLKDMRALEESQEKMYNQRIEDLHRTDLCTKYNISAVKQRKARIAQECYAELRKQMCEQQEKRMRDEAEYHASKMLENRFVHREISREEISKKHQKYCEELDKQVAALTVSRAEEEKKFQNHILKASNDPEFCDALAQEYISHGIDYLAPHPNWNILSRPNDKHVSTKSHVVNYLQNYKPTSEKCFDGRDSSSKGNHTSKLSPSDGRGDEMIQRK